MKKIFTLIISVVFLSAVTVNAQEETYSDNFETDVDYTTFAFDGTGIWQGMNVNTSAAAEDNNTILNEFAATGGGLRIESQNGVIAGAGVSGAYIYRIVPQGLDFTADLKIVGGSYVSFDSTAYHNSCGIFVRDTADGYANANHIYLHFFELWGFHHILKSSLDGAQTEVDVASCSLDLYPTLTQYPWLRLQRVGNVFTAFVSADGFTWTQTVSVTRDDLEGKALEVGIAAANYDNVAPVASVVDNFTLVHPTPAGVAPSVTSEFVAYASYGNIRLSSGNEIMSAAKLYSIDGREVKSQRNIMSSEFEFAGVGTGLYIAVVDINGTKHAQKVVVE